MERVLLMRSFIIAALALSLAAPAFAGWPVIGKFSASSAKKRVAAMKFEASVNGETGEESVRAGVDLAALMDKDAGWFDATAGGFLADFGVYTVAGVLIKLGVDEYNEYRAEKKKPKPSDTPPSGKGDINMQGAVINGNVKADTVGGNINLQGATVNGSVTANTATAETEDDEEE